MAFDAVFPVQTWNRVDANKLDLKQPNQTNASTPPEVQEFTAF